MRSRAQIKAHPIHPMIVAFPIGLWVTGFLMDLVGVTSGHPSLWVAGWYAQLAGCVGAAAAAVFGAIDLFTIVPPQSSAKKRGYTHALLNVVALALFCAVMAARNGYPGMTPSAFSLLLGACGVAVVALSGWLGGTLVYRNQIGVDHRYAGAGKWHERTVESFSRPLCGEDELRYGQMMLIHVAGERVVVGRCADGIVAFSDHCTHRGGPLADGALAGCTVQCPWHGSQFDVRTGAVVSGPAEQPIRTYAVNVRGGEVYVSPASDLPKAA